SDAMTIRCAPGSRATCMEDWLPYSSTRDEGESQLFPPQHTALSAAAEVQEVVHHSPVLSGHDRHTWTLKTIGQTIAWMRSLTVSAICQLLQRLQVVYKRGRAHVHSPDLEYDQKLAAIATALAEARSTPDEVVFLFEDEFTAYLRPLVGSSYRAHSERGQKATGATGETVRLAACVDALSGRVVWRRRGRFNVKEMYRFFYYVNKCYPKAKVIYLALDNWPVHFHGYVLDHLAQMKLPNRIHFLPLPTYAPWTNPTEKYWLKLSREWLRFHPFAGNKNTFKRKLDGWLMRHSAPSLDLLHEVGLLPT
ncbi:MAG: IS630 family transposase, partial [Chloroflexota bacterium]|nr:IS630 family transposase [Chloroflexota bacterium]